jgi:hypothetical protein
MAGSRVTQVAQIQHFKAQMSRKGAKMCTYISEGEKKSPFIPPQYLGISIPHPENNRDQSMNSGDISLVLVFEPRTNDEGPVLLARLDDPSLIVRAARAAVTAAQKRAAELRGVDELIGEFESAEAARLQALLTLLVPGLGARA